MRGVWIVIALVPILAVAQERLQLQITLNGAVVGSNTYETTADGGFKSETSLDLGSVKLASTASGHFKDGKLVDSKAASDTPTGKSEVVYANGKVTASANGKTSSADWKDTTGHLAGNLHPQLFAGSLLAAESEIQKNPASKSIKLDVFFVDGGPVFPAQIRLLQPSSLTVDGKAVTAKRFSVDLANVTLEFAMDGSGHVVAEDVPAQKLRFVASGWEGLFVDPISKFPELSQATFKTKVERGVKVKMRDGVELVCDVVRPVEDGKYPTILERTPYGRGSGTAEGQFYATRGYVFVSQDCRGREDSGGDWDPFVNEGPDGYDTIQWIADQTWSNGNVGMIGGSYSGYVQWAAAVLNPPALKCIVPQVSPPDAMRNIPYDHGVFFLYGDLWWAKIVAGKKTDFTSMKSLPHPEKLNTLPLSRLDDAVLGEDLQFFNKWLDRPTLADWKGMDYTFHIENSHVPALHISGIWDGDEIGTHINWNTLRDLGRKNQWIVFGPWVHAFNTNKSFQDVQYGDQAIIDLDSVTLRWFDTWLKDKTVGQDKAPKVRLFVTGANRWIELPDWPAPSTPKHTLYLSNRGLTEKSGKAESKTYTYDPAKDSEVPKSVLGQSDTEGSTKVDPASLAKMQIFKTEPFTKDTAISAPFNLSLHFKSSAVDTDFFVMVLDIAPNGEARYLGQPGKVRASYLGGMDKRTPLVPGKEYVADIVPWDFAHEFKKGHRLAIAINSTMFPSYARNLGTAEPIKDATKMVAQKNTILMGGASPSSFSYHILWEK